MTNEQMPASPAYSPPRQGAYQLLAALPALWLTLLALFTLAVTVQQGHVPFYGHPDPKDTGPLLLLYYPVLLLLPFVLASLPVSFLLTLLTFWARFPLAPRWGATILYLLGLVLFLLLIPGDPAGLVEWLLD
jgi:hypothetical protein